MLGLDLTTTASALPEVLEASVSDTPLAGIEAATAVAADRPAAPADTVFEAAV